MQELWGVDIIQVAEVLRLLVHLDLIMIEHGMASLWKALVSLFLQGGPIPQVDSSTGHLWEGILMIHIFMMTMCMGWNAHFIWL